MRTRQSVCIKKAWFATEKDAVDRARRSEIVLLPYRCNHCGKFHLTSRTKGKFMSRRPVGPARRARDPLKAKTQAAACNPKAIE